MLQGNWRYLFPVAFTYIGTVVGAGFASGQEIVHFFTRYGVVGQLGIIISAMLFAFFGARMMVLGARLKATSYKEVNTYLFAPSIAKMMNVLVAVMLFGVTGAMISGIGAIFSEQLHLPSILGMGIVIVVSIIILEHGMEGILSVNTIVVPLMMLFSVLMVIHSYVGYRGIDVPVITAAGGLPSSIFSAITYVSFNLAMAQAILVPLGNDVGDERVLKWGAILGAAILGLLLLGANYAISLRGDAILQYQIPMAEVMAPLGAWIKGFFLIIVIMEIFTTLIANAYGLGKRLTGLLSISERAWIWLILITGLLFAQIGFQSFIAYVYPLFGYAGFFYMVMLVVRRNGN